MPVFPFLRGLCAEGFNFTHECNTFTPHMKLQTTNSILMIRPNSFRMNEQTATNNYFQKNLSHLSFSEIQEKALAEFDHFAMKLIEKGIGVIVIEDDPAANTPDSLFPNNWLSLHEEGKAVLYPMFAENRRPERRIDILDYLAEKGFDINDVVDLSDAEQFNEFLEGTGSLVLDRIHFQCFAALSPRTNLSLVEEWCDLMGFEYNVFHAFQTSEGERRPIYHTNVMMSIGENLAILCADCMDIESERQNIIATLKKCDKEILYITEEQLNHFAGNMLQVRKGDGSLCWIMSDAAFHSLDKAQIERLENDAEVLHVPLDIIETLGGGSARCMLAENFLPLLVDSEDE